MFECGNFIKCRIQDVLKVIEFIREIIEIAGGSKGKYPVVLFECNEKTFSLLIFLEKLKASGAIPTTFRIWRLAQGFDG